MDNRLFEISNLKCSYKTSVRPVLEIEELNINKGEIVFIIGPSGVGKSTILETFGVMNNTIKNNLNFTFNFFPNNQPIDMTTIWNRTDSQISEMRRSYFSFIFQSDNLFHSLSGIQNTISASLLQGTKNNKTIKQLKEIFKLIIPELLPRITNDFKISELSGGQRQRLSFARAILSNFKVLFADEPTGNLDWYNAEKLMNFIKDKIKNQQKSAIIVSHDIDLSMNFADKIIYIDRKTEQINNNNHSFGIINNKNIFTKENNIWKSQLMVLTKNKMSEFLKDKFKK